MKPRIEGAPQNPLEAAVVLERVDVVVCVGACRRDRDCNSDLESRSWRVGHYTAIVAFDVDPRGNPLITDAVFHVMHVPQGSRSMWDLLQARGSIAYVSDEPLTWSEALRVAANREARLVAPIVEAHS